MKVGLRRRTAIALGYTKIMSRCIYMYTYPAREMKKCKNVRHTVNTEALLYGMQGFVNESAVQLLQTSGEKYKQTT